MMVLHVTLASMKVMFSCVENLSHNLIKCPNESEVIDLESKLI